jgi:hypothetical protein
MDGWGDDNGADHLRQVDSSWVRRASSSSSLVGHVSGRPPVPGVPTSSSSGYQHSRYAYGINKHGSSSAGIGGNSIDDNGLIAQRARAVRTDSLERGAPPPSKVSILADGPIYHSNALVCSTRLFRDRVLTQHANQFL